MYSVGEEARHIWVGCQQPRNAGRQAGGQAGNATSSVCEGALMCWQLVFCIPNPISRGRTIYAFGVRKLGECEEGTSTHAG